MSETHQKANTQQTDAPANEIVKPTLAFESVTFSDGSVLTFDEDEIVVFVGPNNAGKSAALREMEQFISKHVAQNVIKAATFRKSGTQQELRKYLDENAQKVGEISQYSYAGMGYSIHHSHLIFFDNPTDRHPVAKFFYTRLATETRIIASNPAAGIALYQEVPSHPIHLLLMDNVLAAKISDLFRHAFGEDLIVFRAGGGTFPLYVGDKPTLAPGEDELSRSFVENLRAKAVPLEQQGDGMRSFASVLLYVLTADNHSIQFLDEPDTHPRRP